MTVKTNVNETRSVEAAVEIDAPVDAVWKALTEAEELERWFPLEARATPGEGGEIFTSWGPDVEGTARILEWDPNRRLRTSWFEQRDGKPSPLAVDYRLESSGGRTTLRLVHSGFGHDASWDAEFDGVRSGWAFELRSLRHYLENHRGKQRRVAWARVPLSVSLDEAAERMWSPRALLAGGPRPRGGEGDPYRLQMATGDVLDGKILYDGPGPHFGGTVDSMDRALFRTIVESCGAGPEAGLWLSSWAMSEDQIADVTKRWTDLLKSTMSE